jgi:hypothetical protein
LKDYEMRVSSTLLSSPVRWKGSDRSSASWQRIPTSPLFSSGLVDAPADTIRTRTSTSPFYHYLTEFECINTNYN